MGTRVPAISDRLLVLATDAVAPDVSVVDSWAGATTNGKILTIGLPDLGFAEIGALTQPAVTFQRSSPIGASTKQSQTVEVFCSLDIPAGEGTTPAAVRIEAGEILDALISAVSARGAIDGTEGAYVTENAWYQGDLAAGWGVVVLFTINVDLFG